MLAVNSKRARVPYENEVDSSTVNSFDSIAQCTSNEMVARGVDGSDDGGGGALQMHAARESKQTNLMNYEERQT